MNFVTKPLQGVLPKHFWRERLEAPDALSGSLNFARNDLIKGGRSSLRYARDDKVLRFLNPSATHRVKNI